uniref:T9SS type A sorting domain-containing protein n=1 Tax=uncultured Flavobacterium sp. TaxID=165435 RepID=UPI0030CA390C
GGSCAPCPLATGPTNPPARNVGDVKSIYNGIAVPVAPEYTNEPGVIFDTFGSAVTIASSTLGDGNIVMKYTNHNYSGIQAGTGNLDVNSMTMLHLDVYSPNFTSFKIKLEAVNGSALELEVPFAKTQNSWNSYDIDLSTYTGVDLAHLKWIVPVTNGGVTMYIDNVYFYRPAASTVATLSDLKVDGTTVAGFAPGKINYSVVLPKGTTVIPQITAVTKTNSLAAATINQASALPGDATVVVVSDDASTTKTYTISFSVDTSTPCAGFSTEALEGTFSTGYNYSFVTTGTNVLVTFEILDTDKSGLNPQLYIEPSTFLNMANTSGQTYTYTFAGQTSGAVLNFSLRAAYAGGLVRSKIFNYTVGDACALGTNKFDLASFKAYPNPTKDTWTVTTKNTNISSIQVYDVLGRNVLSLKPNAIEAKIDASSLKTGVYFVKINTLNGSSSLKLVKE